jgi:uncharacterized protein YqhQ
MRLLVAPGLALQKLTTREPDDQMIEAAIAALEPVLVADGIQVRAEITTPRVYANSPAPAAGLASD